MNGGDHFGGEVGEGFALETALGEHFELGVDEGLGGSGSEGDDDLGFDLEDFSEHPRLAVVDFVFARLVVKTALGLRLKFEVFDGVGEVEFLAIETSFFEGLVEKLSGGADKGTA